MKVNPEFVSEFLPRYERALRAREDEAKAEIRALEFEIQRNEELRKKLDRKFLEDAIDAGSYKELKKGLEDEIDGLEERLNVVATPQSIRELHWVFARNVLLDVPLAWERGTVEERQVFQKHLFPRGVKVGANGEFFEPDKDSLFSNLESLTRDFINLASPTGFEPVLPP
jgi:hypothetical protein